MLPISPIYFLETFEFPDSFDMFWGTALSTYVEMDGFSFVAV